MHGGITYVTQGVSSNPNQPGTINISVNVENELAELRTAMRQLTAKVAQLERRP